MSANKRHRQHLLANIGRYTLDDFVFLKRRQIINLRESYTEFFSLSYNEAFFEY